jgi:YfiH family protein
VNLQAPFEEWEGHIRVEIGGASALFTTRRGGFSVGPYTSLNLGMLTADVPDAVRRNRGKLESLIGIPLARIRQVHGTHVRRLSEPPSAAEPSVAEPLEEADGQATSRPGLAPAVLTADCLPIVIAGGGAVAVLHAGWRGLAAGIIPEGVRALRELGAGGPLEAAIGPGAGSCCYEVGEEVHARFAAFAELARSGRNLDLAAIARAQLAQSGVEAVHDVGLCTICSDRSLFFSHRRDGGVTGRQAGIAWLS